MYLVRKVFVVIKTLTMGHLKQAQLPPRTQINVLSISLLGYLKQYQKTKKGCKSKICSLFCWHQNTILCTKTQQK